MDEAKDSGGKEESTADLFEERKYRGIEKDEGENISDLCFPKKRPKIIYIDLKSKK